MYVALGLIALYPICTVLKCTPNVSMKAIDCKGGRDYPRYLGLPLIDTDTLVMELI